MGDLILGVDFKARREREAEMDVASVALIGPLKEIFAQAIDTAPSEYCAPPQDSA